MHFEQLGGMMNKKTRPTFTPVNKWGQSTVFANIAS